MHRQRTQAQQARPRASAGLPSEEQLQQYVEARRRVDEEMGWDQFVRIHNQVATDPALQARVRQQLGAQSGTQSPGIGPDIPTPTQ